MVAYLPHTRDGPASEEVAGFSSERFDLDLTPLSL